MYFNENKKPGELSFTHLLKERKLGDLAALGSNEDFLSDEDDEMKTLEQRYMGIQTKERQLMAQNRDSNEIYKMRSETLERIIQDILEIHKSPELSRLVDQYQWKKKKLEEKDKEGRELAEKLIVVREKCAEEQEQKKHDFYEEYNLAIQQVDVDLENQKSKWKEVLMEKAKMKKELKKVTWLFQRAELKYKFMKEKKKGDGEKLSEMVKEFKRKKEQVKVQKGVIKHYRIDELDYLNEFFCPLCGLGLGNTANVNCGHVICEECYIGSKGLGKCLICQGPVDESAHIQFPCL